MHCHAIPGRLRAACMRRLVSLALQSGHAATCVHDIIIKHTTGTDRENSLTLPPRTFESAPDASKLPPFDVSIATLGILLLELCFGYTLESTPHWTGNPSGSSDLAQDRAAAWEWAERVEGEAGEPWKLAVDWCLGKWRVRTEDDTWRQEFYQVVVEPLRKEAGLT